MDCERFGIDPAAFQSGPREEPKPPMPLWPDMVPSLALFYDAPWNWISIGMGATIRVNISRSELEASARLLGIDLTPSVFSDVRIMEQAALEYWARKR